MKIKLITIIIVLGIFTTCLFAQYDFTVSGGVQLGNVGYDTQNSLKDTSMKPGATFGIETLKGPFIIGAAFVRRGGNLEISSINYSESISLDYLTGYLLFNIPIIDDLNGLFGCQIGKCLGATITYEQDDDSGSITIYKNVFNIDYGLLFGVDYMLHSRLGTRISYYAGYAGVFKNSVSSNFSNSGISICLLFKI
jgi:hypothetical protein